MEMKTLILISFTFGFIAGWGNDKAKQSFYAKLELFDRIFVPTVTVFVIYSFFQSMSFGFMSILQILLGSYIGKYFHKYYKIIFKR